MREIELTTGQYYHVFNRGVDSRKIFSDDLDYQRFYENLYLFSDSKYTNPLGDFIVKAQELSGHEVFVANRVPRVQILSLCLRPTHFHLFLKQLIDGGIASFLQRLQMAYSKYFNNRHGRTGTLFEGTYHAVHVDNEAYFQHLPRYIHLNVLDEAMPGWREGRVTDWNKATEILNSSRWSSHRFYATGEQELPILDQDFVRASFSNVDEYWDYLQLWAGRSSVPLRFADDFRTLKCHKMTLSVLS